MTIFLSLFSYSSIIGQVDRAAANIEGEKYFQKFPIADDPAGSILLLKKAMSWFEKAKNWEKYVDCLNNIFAEYYYSENFDASLNAASEAVEFSKKYLKKSSNNYIVAISNLGIIYDYGGNHNKALQLFQEAVELEEKYTKSNFNICTYLTNIGISYFALGDYDQANIYYKKAYDIIVDTVGIVHHDAAYLLREIATTHKAKGENDIALDYYYKCLGVLNQLERKQFFDQTRWYTYVDMAEIYLQKKDKAKVLYYANKAIKINNQYNLLEDYKTWAVLGKLYQQEGDYRLALEYFKKEKRATETEFSAYPNHPQKALAIANIAGVYSKSGEHPAALKNYQAALQAIAVGYNDNEYQSNPELALFINKLDALEIVSGKARALHLAYQHTPSQVHYLSAAHYGYELATKLIQSLRQLYLAEGSKHLLSEKAVALYEEAIEVALALHQVTGKELYLERAFTYAESNKAVLLNERLRDQMAKGFAGIPESLLAQERDLQADIAYNERKLLEHKQLNTPASKLKIAEIEDKLFDLREQFNQLNKLLETKYPNYYQLKYRNDPVPIADIRKRLSGENTCLLEYMFGNKNYFAFLLTAKEVKVFRLDNKSNIQLHIQDLRVQLSAPPNSARFQEDYLSFVETSKSLYNLILKAPIDAMPQKTKRLVIIPDDLLCFLPFEVLLFDKPQDDMYSYSPKHLDYFFEKYGIVYSYSASLFGATNSIVKEVDKLGFLGLAPSFGEAIADNRDCTTDQLYSLQCTKNEVQSIGNLFNGKTLFSKSANSKAFLDMATKYKILHLATHACIDIEGTGLSKVFFSDGYLTQYDINNLDLHNELTVLSACNTGTGKLLKGEGAMSLSRSFLMAGSASVLTSLWSVDDCATSDIMLAYYKHLKKGLSKDIALQKAKFDYLAGADENNSHPYYWAAFVQFGAVEPIFNNSMPWLGYLLGALAALTAFAIFLKRQSPFKHA